MGVENNEAILATTWDDKAVKKVSDWVERLEEKQRSLFAFVPSIANGKTTIILAPDGSKKGWDTAKETEKLRDDFVEVLRNICFEWVEVGYGEFGQKVLRGNCINQYSDAEYADTQAL